LQNLLTTETENLVTTTSKTEERGKKVEVVWNKVALGVATA